MDANKRTALVIGNSRYETAFGRLRNAGNDASAMAKAFRELGFHVLERKDLTRDQLLLAMDEFRRTLKGSEVAVFFYAGHGLSIGGSNYLVPVRSGFEPESLEPTALRLLAESRLFNAEQALADMAASGAACNIVILDACRTPPTGALTTRGFTPNGLVEMTPPAGSLIAFAADRGQVAFDGDGPNGLFTEELLKQLKTPGLSIERIFKRTRAAVVKRSGGAQIPAEYSRLLGEDVILIEDSNVTAKEEPNPVSAGNSTGQEEAATGIQNVKNLSDESDRKLILEKLIDQMKADLRDASSPSPKVVLVEQRGREIEAEIQTLLPNSPEANRLLSKALNRRGDALLILGHYEEGLDCFNRAAKLDPEDAYIIYNRGRANLLLGRKEQAKEDFNSAAGPRYDQPKARQLALEALNGL